MFQSFHSCLFLCRPHFVPELPGAAQQVTMKGRCTAVLHLMFKSAFCHPLVVDSGQMISASHSHHASVSPYVKKPYKCYGFP